LSAFSLDVAFDEIMPF